MEAGAEAAVASDRATTPPPVGPVAVDATRPGALEVLLGLPGWMRAALAADRAGAAAVRVVVAPATREAVAGRLGDARLAPLDLALVEAPGPEDAVVDGAAVVDRPAVAALAAGADPAAAGTWVAPGAPAAEKRRTLLRSLANPAMDGVVDTWLNRPISRRLTRLLVGTGVSPNAVTVASGVLGVLGAAGIATGDYALGVAGAAVFQLSAAVDCVDGEIARLTYRTSPLGARLDIAVDNAAHVALFAAMAAAARGALGPGLTWGVGAAAVLGGILSFLLVYRLTFGGGAAADGGLRRLLERLTNRDFSIGVLACALVPWWHGALWIVAVGTNAFFLALLGVALWRRPGEERA